MPSQFSAGSTVGMTDGARLVSSMNSLARMQFKKYKRKRKLNPIKSKLQLTSGDGITYGSESIPA